MDDLRERLTIVAFLIDVELKFSDAVVQFFISGFHMCNFIACCQQGCAQFLFLDTLLFALNGIQIWFLMSENQFVVRHHVAIV